MPDVLAVLRASLAERLAVFRGVESSSLPAPLLDVHVRTREPAGLHVVQPVDWEALREEEAAAGRPIPWWARLWPSGTALARALEARPRRRVPAPA